MASLAGLRIGHEEITGVRLEWRRRGPRLLTHASVPLAPGAGIEELTEAFRSLRRELRAPRYAYACLDDRDAVLRIVEAPSMSAREMRRALDLDLERFVPLRREQVYMDFAQLGPAQEPGRQQVAVAGCQRGWIDLVYAAARRARFVLRDIEVEALCLGRALQFLAAGASTFGLLSEERGLAKLTLFREGMPIVARSLGQDLTPTEVAQEAVRSVQFFGVQNRSAALEGLFVLSSREQLLIDELEAVLAARMDRPVQCRRLDVEVRGHAPSPGEIAAIGATFREVRRWRAN